MRKAPYKNQRGVTLIFVIVLLLVAGMVGSTFVSLLSGESLTAMGYSGSTEAFYVALGGLEVQQRVLSQNLEWYRSATDPVVAPMVNLGAGSFDVNTYLPATVLKSQIPTDISVAPIQAYTTDRYPNSGFLQIEEDINDQGEFIRYDGKSGDTFTGITRNVSIGGVQGETDAHAQGSSVYPVTTLSDRLGDLGSPCAPTASASFRIAAHPKFLEAGTLDIEGEEIFYSGSVSSGGVMTLTGVIRCQNLASSSHPSGRPVTPMQIDSDSTDYEAEIVSTGTRSNPLGAFYAAKRVLRRTVRR